MSALVGITSGVRTSCLKQLNMKGLKAFVNGEVLTAENKFVRKNLFFEDGNLLPSDIFVEKAKKQKFDFVDLQGTYITPSLVDQHIHGACGIDFNTANESEIRKILKEMKKWGNSDILATFVPDTIEALNRQMEVIRSIIRKPEKNAARIAGINLEGPFLSPQKAGIHSLNILKKPSVDILKKLDLTDVKVVTVAPELDKDYKGIDYLNSFGIITSAGHSAATAKQVRDSGIKMVTHLFNAMAGFHHRIPSIANEGLQSKTLFSEVNTAFELISPETINLIYNIKPQDKIIFISDALRGTNIKENFFCMGGKKIFIDEKGIAKDQNGVLAGSIKFMGQVAKQIVDSTVIPFCDFIKFASQNPAKLLGIEKDYAIKEFCRPNFTIWDKNTLTPIKTFIKGE